MLAREKPASMLVWLAASDPSLAEFVEYPTGRDPSALVAADLDGDGSTDVATANAGHGSVTLWHGQGDGTFARREDYPTRTGPSSLVAVDVDGDGLLDLATANKYDDSITILFARCFQP